MPHVQKLFEKYKDSKDVQILTISVDDNLGLIEPVAKLTKLTVPVLPAKTLVEQVVPMLGVPQNWIVDSSAVLKMQQLGFFMRDQWVEMATEAIEKARAPAAQ